METLVEFLKANYVYFVFVAGFLVLALIGYIVDSSNTEKRKREENKKSDEEEFALNIPEIGNAKIGETVNKNAGIVSNETESVDKNEQPVELKKGE